MDTYALNSLSLGSLAAYSERYSMDPITGVDGVLRKEWKVDKIEPSDRPMSDALAYAFGADWRRYAPEAEFVLMVRYIKRGVEEAWTMFQAANTVIQCLGYIDDNVIPVCEELLQLQLRRVAYAKGLKSLEALEQRERDLREESKRHKKASEAAFLRLRDGKWGELAVSWNNTMQLLLCIKGARVSERLANCSQFRTLHEAVMDAETVGAKRKAIRLALEWIAGHVDTKTGEVR